MTQPLGFAGDPSQLVTTAEVRARLGYRSAKTWYNDAPRRRASGFPPPVRAGLYRLGALQAWSEAGGYTRSTSTPAGKASRKGDRPPAARQGEEPTKRSGGGPRQQVIHRLHLISGGR